MGTSVGVLLSRRILQRAVRGGRTFERLDYYVEAAKELGVEVVFFDLDAVRLRRRTVTGYVPAGKGSFRQRRVALPDAVHKRALYRNSSAKRLLERLERRGVRVFNPEIPWNKYKIEQVLRSEPRLIEYLPETAMVHPASLAWFRRQLERGAEVFIKPCRGSLGLGVDRVVPLGNGRVRYESRARRRTTSVRGAWKLVRKSRRARFMQVGIDLLEDEGRRVDLRAAVQRGADGVWQVAGVAAKRAGKRAYVTNVARGASVHPAAEVLARSFGSVEADRIMDEIGRLSVLVAATLSRRHPALADLGLDIGVDRQGKPYLIEVNRRDLRITMGLSGQHDAHRLLYRNPIAYARYLLEKEDEITAGGVEG